MILIGLGCVGLGVAGLLGYKYKKTIAWNSLKAYNSISKIYSDVFYVNEILKIVVWRKHKDPEQNIKLYFPYHKCNDMENIYDLIDYVSVSSKDLINISDKDEIIAEKLKDIQIGCKYRNNKEIYYHLDIGKNTNKFISFLELTKIENYTKRNYLLSAQLYKGEHTIIESSVDITDILNSFNIDGNFFSKNTEFTVKDVFKWYSILENNSFADDVFSYDNKICNIRLEVINTTGDIIFLSENDILTF